MVDVYYDIGKLVGLLYFNVFLKIIYFYFNCNWSNLHLMCSGEGLSVHIYDKRHASWLLDNTVCHGSYLDFLEDKI
jgi:hypothetical protein